MNRAQIIVRDIFEREENTLAALKATSVAPISIPESPLDQAQRLVRGKVGGLAITSSLLTQGAALLNPQLRHPTFGTATNLVYYNTFREASIHLVPQVLLSGPAIIALFPETLNDVEHELHVNIDTLVELARRGLVHPMIMTSDLKRWGSREFGSLHLELLRLGHPGQRRVSWLMEQAFPSFEEVRQQTEDELLKVFGAEYFLNSDHVWLGAIPPESRLRSLSFRLAALKSLDPDLAERHCSNYEEAESFFAALNFMYRVALGPAVSSHGANHIVPEVERSRCYETPADVRSFASVDREKVEAIGELYAGVLEIQSRLSGGAIDWKIFKDREPCGQFLTLVDDLNNEGHWDEIQGLRLKLNTLESKLSDRQSSGTPVDLAGHLARTKERIEKASARFLVLGPCATAVYVAPCTIGLKAVIGSIGLGATTFGYERVRKEVEQGTARVLTEFASRVALWDTETVTCLNAVRDLKKKLDTLKKATTSKG